MKYGNINIDIAYSTIKVEISELLDKYVIGIHEVDDETRPD